MDEFLEELKAGRLRDRFTWIEAARPINHLHQKGHVPRYYGPRNKQHGAYRDRRTLRRPASTARSLCEPCGLGARTKATRPQ